MFTENELVFPRLLKGQAAWLQTLPYKSGLQLNRRIIAIFFIFSAAEFRM